MDYGKLKLLVPGAGYGQEIIIRRAKQLGIYVVVVSPKGDYPGLPLADKIYYEDVRDKQRVLEIATIENIDGIVSDQNDIPVETIGYVSEKLNLIGNSYETSKLFSRKHLMREKCKQNSISVVPFSLVASEEEALLAADSIGYPVICKPVDNQSSKGVSLADTKEQLAACVGIAFDSSFSNQAIIEKFIPGQEFVVEGLAIDGEFRNLLLLERTYFDLEGAFIPSMVTSPTSLTDNQVEDVLELNTRICTLFGFNNGLSHSEYIFDADRGEFYLVETAARGGGVFTSSHLLSYACGFDTAKFLIQLSLGVPLNIADYRFASKAVRYICFYIRAGKVLAIRGAEDIKKMKAVLDFYDQNIQIGQTYSGLQDKSSRLGPILLGADSMDELERVTREIAVTLEIETDLSKNAIEWY